MKLLAEVRSTCSQCGDQRFCDTHSRLPRFPSHECNRCGFVYYNQCPFSGVPVCYYCRSNTPNIYTGTEFFSEGQPEKKVIDTVLVQAAEDLKNAHKHKAEVDKLCPIPIPTPAKHVHTPVIECDPDCPACVLVIVCFCCY